MRPRKQIELDRDQGMSDRILTLEVLLDVRDLLGNLRIGSAGGGAAGYAGGKGVSHP